MNERQRLWCAERGFDFVCGFFLGLLFCPIIGVSEHVAHPIAGMFVVALSFGGASTLFGRHFWRFISHGTWWR